MHSYVGICLLHARRTLAICPTTPVALYPLLGRGCYPRSALQHRFQGAIAEIGGCCFLQLLNPLQNPELYNLCNLIYLFLGHIIVRARQVPS
jgi:hypothetical protein